MSSTYELGSCPSKADRENNTRTFVALFRTFEYVRERVPR